MSSKVETRKKRLLTRYERMQELYTLAKSQYEWVNLRRTSPYVVGTGNVRPKILFVSLHPTRTCMNGGIINYFRHSPVPLDIARHLFVEPSECFYTSLIKYGPPTGRALTQQELHMGKVVTQEEIRVLAPDVIVVLNPIAGQALLGLETRNQLHNAVYKIRGIPVVTITAPISLERFSPSWRKYYLSQVEPLRDVL